MKNILFEAKHTSNFYTEYLHHIDFYKNYVRKGNFITYLKINDFTTYDENTKVTSDRHHGGIKYDAYELTPLLQTWGIVNASTYNPNVKGRMYDGESEIVIYTIKEPRQNDLVIFSQKPHNSEDVFRVKDINTVIFANNSNINIYKLSLEYSNMDSEEINSLNIYNTYYYLVDKEKYLHKDDYIKLLKNLSNFENGIKNYSFNEEKELYDGLTLEENKKIMELLEENKYYFSKIKVPYGSIGITLNENFNSGKEIFQFI